MADRNSLVASRRGRDLRQIATGLAFLSPNILGFLAFTAIPLVFSLVMAFTDWNLQLHNQFKQSIDPVPVKFVGLDNFKRLLFEPGAEITWRFWEHLNPQFWKYLGNTLYLMIGLPFAIGGSLLAASMLSRDLKGGSRSNWAILLAGAVLVASILFLLLLDAGAMGNTLLIVGLLGAILVVGVAGGTTVYRTLFYLPYFTAGVATFLLWKKIYSPSGPLTLWLNRPLAQLGEAVNALPPGLVRALATAWIILALLLLFFGIHRLYMQREDGDLTVTRALLPMAVMLIAPIVATLQQWITPVTAAYLWLGVGGVIGIHVVLTVQRKPYIAHRSGGGSGSAAMLASAIMVGMFILLGLASFFQKLPVLAAEGLHSPEWLTDPHWAKPSLILMGLWAAIGSNSMLMYLAALTNVPQELYEAADIDGAKPFTKFWNVTWPQLAPTTFFLVVMGMIGGLQGGFEMARVMTNGGPAGQTTTLAYYIYTEGFETGRLGYASAVSWTLFLLVLVVTLFNWKFGNRYVND